MSRARRTRLPALAAIAALALVLAAVGVALATSGSGSGQRAASTGAHRAATGARSPRATGARSPRATAHRHRQSTTRKTASAVTGHQPPAASAAASFRIQTIRITDPHRRIGGAPRSFVTVIRIPSGVGGPFPLIVFGHGYAVTPTPYAPLLDAWAKAGYVVAAPVFPLENANAPGGPNENDLPNQPRDMSLVIDRMLTGSFGRLVRHHRIAVTGQSDGGDTALAAAFDPRVRDARVSVAVILSGAYDPFISRFAMPSAHVPLLATQGTADTINPSWMTHQFYDPATPPKFLLTLRGQGHLPPYTQPGITLNTVVRGTTAFLNCYLKGMCARWNHFRAKGTAGTPSVLTGR